MEYTYLNIKLIVLQIKYINTLNRVEKKIVNLSLVLASEHICFSVKCIKEFQSVLYLSEFWRRKVVCE